MKILHSSNWVQNWLYNENININKNVFLQKDIYDTNIFLKNNTDIILTNADKSNKTILMNKNDYNSKIYDLLNNPSTYIKLKKDPTNEINNTLTITLNELKEKILLMKNFTNFSIVAPILHPNFMVYQNTEYHIKDSFEFKKKISIIHIPNNFTIISLDAVSMYTNISWNLIRKSITNLHKTSQVCEIYNIDYRESRKVITFPYIQNFQEQLCRI